MLALTLFPFHYHLHHQHQVSAQGAQDHDHIAHLHLLVDVAGDGHHEHSHALDPAPDVVKNNGAPSPLFALLLVLLILLPPQVRILLRSGWIITQPLPHFSRHNTPPLRAPPHV